MATKIEWAQNPDGTPGETWNPMTGCTKISPGCKHCYAETWSVRHRGRYGYPSDNPFKPTFHYNRLGIPDGWKKPRTIFVNSMSDIFHEDYTNDQIKTVFYKMISLPRHTCIVLTKRVDRMLEWFDWFWCETVPPEMAHIRIGCSVENQHYADERIPKLLSVKERDGWKSKLFVSVEPLLGPIQFHHSWLLYDRRNFPKFPGLDWVIVGGESGHGARPMHPDWVRGIRDQCSTGLTPFFFKQWGKWYPSVPKSGPVYVPITQEAHDRKVKCDKQEEEAAGGKRLSFHIDKCKSWDDGVVSLPVGKKVAGRELDGRTWDEFPGGTR